MKIQGRDFSLEASKKHLMSLLPKVAAGSMLDPSHVLFRRERRRWALQAPAAIRYHAGDDKVMIMEATVEDLSASGIGLLSKDSMPADISAEVFVTSDSQTYSATVRIMHVTAVADGFRIGCEFVVREEA